MTTIGAQLTMQEDKIDGRHRYEVESDLRALRDVSKIKKDQFRMSSVKKLLKEEMGALAEIAMDKGIEYKKDMSY